MLIAMCTYDTVENQRTAMTKATLESLLDTVDFNAHRLIVSDNGSIRETLDVFDEMQAKMPFEVLINETNAGTANAINKVWRSRQKGEHAVKMDNDVVIHQSGWCDRMEEVFRRAPDIGIVGLKRKDLIESPSAKGDMRSTLRMLPHTEGQRWLVVEEVRGVIGTCQGFSSDLLDKIGYLWQPSIYGFDDALASARAHLAGFKRVFLHGFDIDHIDPGGDEYCEWKQQQAAIDFPAFNTAVVLYSSGAKSLYYDGGFDDVQT